MTKSSSITDTYPKAKLEVKDTLNGTRYFLGENYPNVYFTQREAEIALLLPDLKYQEIANKLDISRRTVEHYSEAMQNKLACKSKHVLCKLMNGSGLTTQLQREINVEAIA